MMAAHHASLGRDAWTQGISSGRSQGRSARIGSRRPEPAESASQAESPAGGGVPQGPARLGPVGGSHLVPGHLPHRAASRAADELPAFARIGAASPHGRAARPRLSAVPLGVGNAARCGCGNFKMAAIDHRRPPEKSCDWKRPARSRGAKSRPSSSLWSPPGVWSSSYPTLAALSGLRERLFGGMSTTGCRSVTSTR